MAALSASIAISASSSLDNLSVGIGYACKGVRVTVVPNVIVSTVNASGLLLTMIAGKTIVRVLPPSIANLLGGVVFCVIGCWELVRLSYLFATGRLKYQEEADDDNKDAATKSSSDLIFAAASETPPAAASASDVEAQIMLPVDDEEKAEERPRRVRVVVDECAELDECAEPNCMPLLSDCLGRAGDHYYETSAVAAAATEASSSDASLPMKDSHVDSSGSQRSTEEEEAPVAPTDEKEPDTALFTKCSIADRQLNRASIWGLGRTSDVTRNMILLARCLRCFPLETFHRRALSPDAETSDDDAFDKEQEQLPTAVAVADAKEKDHVLVVREAVVLAFALTLTNIAAGLAAGAAGLDVLVTTLFTWAFSFLFMLAGQVAGRNFVSGAKRKLNLGHHEVNFISGLIFLSIGLTILL